MWDRMAAYLRSLLTTLPERPRALLIVSAHWEAPVFTVNAGAAPPLLFDYYGFPKHTYQLTFPALGAPLLAERIRELLEAAGITTTVDAGRGYDHGVFIPFKLITPQADIPIVQLSMKKGLEVRAHIAAGVALQSLRDEGVLIVGSGMSWHNMQAFDPAYLERSRIFDHWLNATLGENDATRRESLLENWQDAPEGRTAQPYPDHLLPLMVAAGAGRAARATRDFTDVVMGVQVSAWRFTG